MADKNPTVVLPVVNPDVRPSGACINTVVIRQKLREQIAARFETARGQGATLVRTREVANAFLAEIEEKGMGFEVVEEKPLRPLSHQAAPLLAKLASAPMLRKRTSVWDAGEPVTESPEQLFQAAMRSLGFSSVSGETFEESNERQHVACAKKKWWGR